MGFLLIVIYHDLQGLSNFVYATVFMKGIVPAPRSKLATTTSSGGLLLALQRAMLLLAQKGGIASTFTGPL